jgi:hypothetical protein
VSTPELEQLLQRAITHVNAGELDQGRALLEKILEQDPKNDRAWVWLSGCVDDPMQRRICLQQALSANPTNQAALDGMRALDGDLVQVSSGRPSLLESRLSAISMGETAASMPTPQAAPPPSSEETSPAPAWGQESSDAAAPSQEAQKRPVLRIVLLGVVGLLLLCVVCSVVVNFVVLPMLNSGLTIQP